ncbi:MAG: 50S ribosomal protein L23 [Kiritimatiellia bacterium]|jgi:large subunit ribosomal protein L23
MKHVNDIIKGIITTEKGTALQEQNRYMLRVAKAANKIEIKKAVEDLFNVTVLAVNTQNYDGVNKVLRNRRTVKTPDWKRAIVTLKPGDQIDPL